MRFGSGFGNRLVRKTKQRFVERDRLNLPDPLPLDVDVAILRELLARLLRVIEHLRERFCIKVPLIERDPAIFHHASDDAWLGRARTDRADAVTASFRNLVNLRAEPSGSEKRIAVPIHRCAARVRSLAVEVDGVSLDSKRAENGSKRQVEVEQHRALFNMELDVSRRVFL